MAQNRSIVITNTHSTGKFPTTNVEQSDQVFWVNNDSVPHWPVPWCSGLNIAPGKTSNAFQAFPGNSGIIPQQIQYTCAVHPTEVGILNVFADFVLATAPFTGKANTNIQIATGGMSPYNWTNTQLPAGLTLAEATPGSSNGFGVVATAAGTYNFTLNATDNLGVTLTQQPIKVTVS